LELLKAPIKASKAIAIAESIFQLEIKTPHSKAIIKKHFYSQKNKNY
jgi:hypothetical protein